MLIKAGSEESLFKRKLLRPYVLRVALVYKQKDESESAVTSEGGCGVVTSEAHLGTKSGVERCSFPCLASGYLRDVL